MVRVRKLMLIWHCHPTFLIGFHSWLMQVPFFFWPRLCSVLSCHVPFISYNLGQFLSLYLLLLTLLKSTGQGLCRMAFNLGLSVVSSGVDLGMDFGKMPRRVLCPQGPRRGGTAVDVALMTWWRAVCPGLPGKAVVPCAQKPESGGRPCGAECWHGSPIGPAPLPRSLLCLPMASS